MGCGHLAQCDDGSGDVPCCAYACNGFVASWVCAPELLDLAEVVFDEMSPFAGFGFGFGFGIVRDVQDAVAFCWNDGIGTRSMQLLAQMVCAKRFVRCPAMVCLQTMRGGQQGVEGQPVNQGRQTGNFAALTWKQRKAHQVARRARQGRNFRRQPAFGTSDRLISSPPFAPLACR